MDCVCLNMYLVFIEVQLTATVKLYKTTHITSLLPACFNKIHYDNDHWVITITIIAFRNTAKVHNANANYPGEETTKAHDDKSVKLEFAR